MDTVIISWRDERESVEGFSITKEQFKTILARACNSWEKAPVPVLELHDLVIHGKLLQPYASMPRFTGREDLSETDNMQLDQRLKSAAEKSSSSKKSGDSE